MALSIVPLMTFSVPVPLEEKQPQTIILTPPCLTVGMVFLGSYEVPSFLPMCLKLFPQKSLILVSSDHNILFQNEAGFSRWRLANSRRAFTCLGFSRGVFLRVRECSPTRWRVRLNLSLLTFVPAACSSFWSSPRVVNGLCITFLTMDLGARSLTLRGHPFRGRSVVSPCFFHFQMMAIIILMGILSTSEIFRYPIPRLWWSIITIRSCWESSFVFAILKTFTCDSQIFNDHSNHMETLWCVAGSDWSAEICKLMWNRLQSKTAIFYPAIFVFSECVQNFCMLLSVVFVDTFLCEQTIRYFSSYVVYPKYVLYSVQILGS